MLAARNTEQIGFSKVVEECLPLFRILLILKIEIHEIDTVVRAGFGKTILPDP